MPRPMPTPNMPPLTMASKRAPHVVGGLEWVLQAGQVIDQTGAAGGVDVDHQPADDRPRDHQHQDDLAQFAAGQEEQHARPG